MFLLTRFFLGPLLVSAALLLNGLSAQAQVRSDLSDPIAQKAYSARYDRVYALAGAALPNYKKLNDVLEPTRFPTLNSGAFVAGVGYGQGFGPISLSLEYRWSIRSHNSDSTNAYSVLRSHTISLLAGYHLLVTNRYVLSVLAGPSYSLVDLTLKEPDPLNSPAGTFTAQLRAPGDKRRLYQTQFLLGAGLQLDRHFVWTRRNDVQACGRARQINVGLRVQYDYNAKSYNWRTERPLFRKPNRLTADPTLNPLGASATLVVGGLFNRY
jgi:hypothetical protein